MLPLSRGREVCGIGEVWILILVSLLKLIAGLTADGFFVISSIYTSLNSA